MSHAHWPFLTKMFMHLYDLIKATLRNKEKWWWMFNRTDKIYNQTIFLISTCVFCFTPSKHSTMKMFPCDVQSPLWITGTCHSVSIWDNLLQELFKLRSCAIHISPWTEKIKLVTNSKISGMIAPFQAMVCSWTRMNCYSTTPTTREKEFILTASHHKVVLKTTVILSIKINESKCSIFSKSKLCSD